MSAATALAVGQFQTYLSFLACFESIVLLAGILANIGVFMLINTFFLIKEKNGKAKAVIGVSIFAQLFMFGDVLSTPLLLKARKEGAFGFPPSNLPAQTQQILQLNMAGTLATSSPAFRLASYLLTGVAFSMFHRGVFKRVSGTKDLILYIICCLALALAPTMELVALSGGALGPSAFVLGGTNIMVGLVFFIFAVMTLVSVRALKIQLELDNSPILSQLKNKLPKDKITQIGFLLPQVFIGAFISHIIAGAALFGNQVLVSATVNFNKIMTPNLDKIPGEVLDFFFFMCTMAALMVMTWYAHVIPVVNTAFDGSIVTGFTSDSKGEAKV